MLTINYKILLLSFLTIWLGSFYVSAQIIDEQGQYVDTVFNDHIDRTAEDFVKASILISDPVQGVLSAAGHTAIRVQCPSFDMDYVFHYVRYHMNDSISEISALLTGKFAVQMVADTFATYVKHNAELPRGLTEYPLNLTPQEEQELWRILDEELVSGKQLKYEFVQEGCAVKTSKLIKRVLGAKQIDYSACDPRFFAPQYEVVSAAMQHAPWLRFIMLTGLYGKTYRTGCANNLLIPSDLATAWQTVTVDGHPLLGDGVRLVPDNYYQAKGWLTPIRLALLLLLLSIVGLFIQKSYVDWIILGMQVLMALFVLLLSALSSSVIHWNWLLIPFNLLPAVCWHWRRFWALPYAMILAIWCIVMLFVPHMLVDTTHIVLTASFAIILCKQYIQTVINKSK